MNNRNSPVSANLASNSNDPFPENVCTHDDIIATNRKVEILSVEVIGESTSVDDGKMDLDDPIEVIYFDEQCNELSMETFESGGGCQYYNMENKVKTAEEHCFSSASIAASVDSGSFIEKMSKTNEYEQNRLEMPFLNISDIPLPASGENEKLFPKIQHGFLENSIMDISKAHCFQFPDGGFSSKGSTFETLEANTLLSMKKCMFNLNLHNGNANGTVPDPSTLVYGTENDFLNTIENGSMQKEKKEFFKRSISLRKSCDSQLSDVSSSFQSNSHSVALTPSSSSSGILEDYSRENSSSPFLKQNKRHKILKDTASEEEFRNSDIEEMTSDINLKNEFVHQTYDSDDESPSPVDSTAMKYNIIKISDFDLMMQQKRAERKRGRKRGSDFLTSNDELIDQLIDRMERAAHQDRKLNKKGLPAIKKVSMLKYVVSQLRKKDLQSIFLEHNILKTLTAWLSPLPSECLPCLQIRESILRLLEDFPRIDTRVLRHSGIGKILKLLREHPDETKENKERCNLLITKWTCPILDWSREYRSMSKRERQQRDYELSLKYSKQKPRTQCNFKKRPNIVDITVNPNNTEATHPGEPGWVPRARVPQPSVRDYIKRPESKLECQILTKTAPSRFEVLSKKYQKAKRNGLIQKSGANLSIVGDKM